MKILKNWNSKTNKTRVKKRDDFLYNYLIATLIVGVIHYYFFESHYIGSDNRYDLFVFWIPVVVGIFFIVKFNILSNLICIKTKL